MKRVFSIVLALTLLVALAVPACANEFVPSIEAQTATVVKKPVLTDKDGKEVEVKATTISLDDALQQKNPEGAAAELVKAYDDVKQGKAPLPEKDLVVTHLMDVSVDEATTEVLKAGGTVDIVFNLGVKSGVKVYALTYNNGAWDDVEKVVNNGDGTVTVTFKHFCPVAFAFSDGAPKTGDAMRSSMILWTSVMALSAVAVVALVVVRTKRSAK